MLYINHNKICMYPIIYCSLNYCAAIYVMFCNRLKHMGIIPNVAWSFSSRARSTNLWIFTVVLSSIRKTSSITSTAFPQLLLGAVGKDSVAKHEEARGKKVIRLKARSLATRGVYFYISLYLHRYYRHVCE